MIDTNVLVSALLTKHEDASPLQVVKKMFHGDIIALYDEEIIREYAEVLRRPKFRFSGGTVATLLQAIMTYGLSVDRINTGEKLIDPKDVVFYEVAMTKQDDNAYLITGNKKHFPLRTFIVTPSEMLDIMKRNKELALRKWSAFFYGGKQMNWFDRFRGKA